MNDYVGFKKVADSYFQMTRFGGKDSPPLKKQGLILTFTFAEIEYSTLIGRHRGFRLTDNGHQIDDEVSQHEQETIRIQLRSDSKFSCIGEDELISKFGLSIVKPDDNVADNPHQVSVRIEKDGNDYPSDACIYVWLTLPAEEFDEIKRKIIHNEIDSGFIRFTIPESDERVFTAPFKLYPVNDLLSDPDPSLRFTNITYPYKLIPDNYHQLWEGVSPTNQILLDEYDIGWSKTIKPNKSGAEKKTEPSEEVMSEAYRTLLLFGWNADDEQSSSEAF